jgi:hypothetical protein
LGGDSGATGRGVHASASRGIEEWMYALADRLRRVRICCGDWKRILGRSPTECIGITGVFLDPPYSAPRDSVYSTDDRTVAPKVREWAIAHGANPMLRIALCGYAGEHEMPADWSCLAWKANGGHGNASQGRGREYGTGAKVKTAVIHLDERAALAREITTLIANQDGDLFRQIQQTAHGNAKKCVHCQSVANFVDELLTIRAK